MNSSNDQSGITKLNPVLIRLFDDNKGKVSLQLLDMGACKEGTAEPLHSKRKQGRLGKLCCYWAGQHSGGCKEKEFHHDTGIGEEQKYIYKWLSLPHNPQHCKQSSGTIFRSVTF